MTSRVAVFVVTGGLLLVTGGGPTKDKPTVTFEPPQDPDTVAHSFTIRVPDCTAARAGSAGLPGCAKWDSRRRPDRITCWAPGRLSVQHDRVASSTPVACPICRRSLRWTADRWLAAFDCDRCGQFSDFGGASLSPAQGRRFPQGHGPSGTSLSES